MSRSTRRAAASVDRAFGDTMTGTAATSNSHSSDTRASESLFSTIAAGGVNYRSDVSMPAGIRQIGLQPLTGAAKH